MANKDLFKQAIADAKSIREAAIANAKLALEESLTPQLKELLAQRLAEMEEEEAPAAVLSEEEATEEATEEVAEEVEEETLEEAIGPDGLQEVEAEEEGEEGAEEEGEAEGEEEAGEEAEGDSEESEDEAEEEEVGEMSVEDLKDLIRDVLMQVMGDEEAAQEDELEAGAEDMGAEDMTAVDDTEINIDELMAELALINDPEGATAHGNVAEEEEEQLDEVISEALAELMSGLDADTLQMLKDVAENLKTSPEGLVQGMLALAGVAGVAPLIKTINMAADLGKAAFTKVIHALSKKNMEEAPAAAPMESNELAEALTTIETLRNELNETNLLNAKLLYVNKVFKANNLTESQKANVIAAFDKAETVKEVKLVYETVSENATATGKKEVVREAKGFASAATGASTKPAVIAEANAAVLRMQKLAGIIK